MDYFRFRLRIYLIVFGAVILAGTLGFSVIEDLTLMDALYFSIVSIATVGYGDIHPVTAQGKILAIVMIILGVGTFLGVVANATEMMLNKREKIARLEKMNMVIGVFFSESGTSLLGYFSKADPAIERIRNDLIITGEWSGKSFEKAVKTLQGYDYAVDMRHIDLEHLRANLTEKRDFLLRLLENPMLLEHEAFTELLRAVFHLTEELTFRNDLLHIPKTDVQHLAGDIRRVYTLLVVQWLYYMQHLRNNYPYLFSLAIRTNPFNHLASPVVQ